VRPAGLVGLVLAAAAVVGLRPAAASDPPLSPRLEPGSLEVGVSGALRSANGTTTVDFAPRLGWLFGAGSAVVPVELEAAWSHVRMRDVVDVTAGVQWTRALSSAPTVWPFVGALAGVRQEWVGSFAERRVPVGGAVGLRVLVGGSAAIRTEYRLLWVLDDPVDDYREHRILVGLSVLFPPSP
jgi:hypothetical protein